MKSDGYWKEENLKVGLDILHPYKGDYVTLT